MKLQRRTLLRGMFQGSVAVMGVPFLDCFLDSNGQALAATGQRIPTRFSTFFFGLGLTTSLWVPKKAGLDYDTTVQLKPLEPFKKKMNVFSGMRVMVDDNPNFQHWSGNAAIVTGIAPTKASQFDSKTIDQTIADVIGRGTHKTVEPPLQRSQALLFRSGRRYASCRTLSHVSIPACSDQDSGPFQRDWKPDPQVMLQQSVLSAVTDERKDFMKDLGRATAPAGPIFHLVREAEMQMAAELKRPDVIAKVAIPGNPGDMPVNYALPNVRTVTPLMARLGALAMATDQTRVFNLAISEPGSNIFVPGDPLGYHITTHMEAIDLTLGYQPKVAEYNIYSMEILASVLKEMDAIQEGDGTLLDHSMVMAYSDQSFAKIHAVDGIPIMLAGNASGRMKTGYHIAGGGNPVSRVGLTVQKAMGISIDGWGKGSMETKAIYTELLA
jgi:hypothetical protein